jgi:hypothetical protein
MDNIALIYWAIILIIVLYPNYIFFKRLKNIGKKNIVHKSVYFLSSVLLPFLIMCFFMLIATSPRLMQILDLKIDYYEYSFRIIYASIVFPISILANLYFANFYLKRISKAKNENKNEIELIGKE